MRLLAAGGTGFIGSAAIDAFLASAPAGWEVRVMTRTPSRPLRWGERARPVRGDVSDASSLDAAVQGADVVLHAIQFPNHPVENPKRGWTYEKVDGEGTERLVAAAKRAGVKRYVYVSGAGTDERRTEPWFRAKLRAEKAVRGAFPDSHVIVRSSWVYGPGDRTMSEFAWFSKWLPFVPMIGDGAERVQPLHVADLAEVLAKAALGTGQGTYEAGCHDAWPMWCIMQLVQKACGHYRPIIPHPIWLMKLVARAMQVLPSPPLSPAAIDFIRMECPVDPKPCEAAFGVRFRDLPSGLQDYLGGS
ncbi:MAG: NAD(P)H-binding protein [Planctomycetota bacterium]